MAVTGPHVDAAARRGLSRRHWLACRGVSWRQRGRLPNTASPLDPLARHRAWLRPSGKHVARESNRPANDAFRARTAREHPQHGSLDVGLVPAPWRSRQRDPWSMASAAGLVAAGSPLDVRAAGSGQPPSATRRRPTRASGRLHRNRRQSLRQRLTRGRSHRLRASMLSAMLRRLHRMIGLGIEAARAIGAPNAKPIQPSGHGGEPAGCAGFARLRRRDRYMRSDEQRSDGCSHRAISPCDPHAIRTREDVLDT